MLLLREYRQRDTTHMEVEIVKHRRQFLCYASRSACVATAFLRDVFVKADEDISFERSVFAITEVM